MKRLILIALLFCGACVYAQENNTTNIDSLQKQMIQLEKILKSSGELIELGGFEKNLGIGFCAGGGILIGATGVYSIVANNNKFLIAGLSIGGAALIAGIIFDILGNKKISDGGLRLREISITGNGIANNF